MMKYELFLMMNKMGNAKERILRRDHVSRRLIMSLSLSEVRKNLTYESIVYWERHSSLDFKFQSNKIKFDS
jgi:hypothetical protein